MARQDAGTPAFGWRGTQTCTDMGGLIQATLCVRDKAQSGTQTPDRQIDRQTETERQTQTYPQRLDKETQTHRQLRGQTDKGADRQTQTA